MPTVALIDGVKIQFYAAEHPPPHFHAILAEHRASIGISPLRVLHGHLPPAKREIVLSWAESRRDALLQAWTTMALGRRPERIE